MTDENDLGQALNDVRKAYRLIWLYQTRIKDTVRIKASAVDTGLVEASEVLVIRAPRGGLAIHLPPPSGFAFKSIAIIS
jgi:hypothetical protein